MVTVSNAYSSGAYYDTATVWFLGRGLAPVVDPVLTNQVTRPVAVVGAALAWVFMRGAAGCFKLRP